MIIWLFLFLVIVVISFILAYQSMKDYEEHNTSSPSGGIYLIQHTEALTAELLDKLHQEVIKNKQAVSLERIYKGQRNAYIIAGSKQIIEGFTELNLLELEDYTSNATGEVLAWEMGSKNYINFHLNTEALAKQYFENLPPFQDDEQFYFQIVFRPESGSLWGRVKGQKGDDLFTKLLKGIGLLSNYDDELKRAVKADIQAQEVFKNKKTQKVFAAQFRVIFFGSEARMKELADKLSGEGVLVKIPRPLTSSQIFNVYKQRKFLIPNTNNIYLTSQEIVAFF